MTHSYLCCVQTFLLTIAAMTIGLSQPVRAAAADPVDFAGDIRPILESRCYECHAAETREAGLRLDRKAPALTGGDAGQVIIPEDAAGSPLIERVTSDDP